MAGELGWLNPTDSSRRFPPYKVVLHDNFRIGWPAPSIAFGWFKPWEATASRNSSNAASIVAIRGGRAFFETSLAVAAPTYFQWFASWSAPGRSVGINRSAANIPGITRSVTNTGGTVTAAFNGLVAKRVTGAATNTVQIRGRPTT